MSGGGRFGTWVTDEYGLPAYRYELDQFADPLGTWNPRLVPRTSEDVSSAGTEWDSAPAGNIPVESGRDPDAYPSLLAGLRGLNPPSEPDKSNLHWHQLGNDRYVAVCTNDGWTQLYSHEFGPRWINMCRPEVGTYAGGVSFARIDGRTLSTLYGGHDAETEVERLWGCSYSRITVTGHGICLERTIFAPFGDSPFLIASVRIKNLTNRPLLLSHLEYWDLHIHPLDFTGPQPWQFDTQRRDEVSELLYSGYSAEWFPERSVLIGRHPWREVIDRSRDWPGSMQRHRPDVCLVALGAPPSSVVTDRTIMFPDADPYHPGCFRDASAEPSRGPGNDTRSSQPVLGMLTEQEVRGGSEIVLGFAYGALPPQATETEIEMVRRRSAGEQFRASMEAWRDYVPKVEVGDADLTREAAWSAYYVRSGAVYHQGLQAHTIPQGGAYQYLAGVNAGPRATLQHALPLIWLAPEIAKETIRFTLAQTHPSGEIPYSEVANGLIETLRYIPSDNDLWLLWVLSDYVLATRDKQFLREICSYWPPPYTRPEPVWEHAVRAFRHLVEGIGTGPHGLLRMRTSDWNDAVIREGGVPMDRVWEQGESTLNSAMGVHVLRRFAELARYAEDTAIEQESLARASSLAAAVRASWRGRHLNRGWRDAESEVGYSDLYLKPQPWALITEILEPSQRHTLLEEMADRLSDPLGTRIFAAGEEGNPPTAGGGQWLSINSTLVWGLSKVDIDRAWHELKANTLHNHAETYPEVWFGIWSGPDTYLPSSARRPGETWAWPGLFSMQAWPVQIIFPHSEVLNSLLWMMGLQSCAAGLIINPQLPAGTWSFQSHTLSISYDEVGVSGTYRGSGSDPVTIQVMVPAPWVGEHLEVMDSGGTREVVVHAGQPVDLLVATCNGLEEAFRIRRHRK
jgi:Glycosyl hydrolase 36 superfamily, catalytic domain